MIGLIASLLVYVLIFVLHLLVPARWVDGYVRDATTGKPLRYRLNGLRVFCLVVGLYALVCRLGWLPWDFFWIHRWQMVVGSCALGLLFTVAIVLPASPHRSFLADVYFGRIENPQWGGGRVDAKMLLYLFGALMLELNVLSFTAHHVILYVRDPSPGIFLYAALFTFFLVDYLSFEEVHLYTYDFFAERLGFKLGWGCLVFYPFFYAVGLWTVAERPNPHTPWPLLVLCAIVFFVGWVLSRGANLQKFLFKTRPEAKLLGVLSPVAVGAGGRQLLCSGFWALSRHINYLGEILMALGLTLALGYPGALAPWLYPLYYVGMLASRQHSDDERCAEKYGELWQEYCRRVPYRIVPWLY